MYSLRRTLAVRFSLTVFVALLLIALWAYLGARRILRDELDRGLLAASQIEAAALAQGLPIAPHPGPPERDRFVATVNRFVAARNADGDITATNTPLAVDLALDRRSFARAPAEGPVWVNQSWEGEPIRSVYVPAPRGNSTGATVIQVAASLDPLRAGTREILVFMLGTVLLGSVATAIGGAWLARSSVAPVRTITRQAESVKPQAVGQRITAHADAEEFQGLVRVLNDMLARLERALESQRRMIADAGHDLRTPLTAMRSAVEIGLRGTRRPEEYRELLTSVLEEIDHLQAMSDALITLARVEAGELAPHCVATPLRDVAAASVERARGHADGRDIRLTDGTGDDVAEVDPDLVTLVLDQLLDNAVVHTPSGTRVAVHVRGEPRTVAIAVEDDGPGLPEELYTQLFDRFYRADPARTRAGAGLGLTIAAAIATAHGGTITADRGALGGLRVTLRLPRDRQGPPPDRV